MITEQLKTEKATKPASRWRNKWLALRDYDTWTQKCHRGKEHWGSLVFPCRDTAETHAQEWVAENSGCAKCLGAFPVEGA